MLAPTFIKPGQAVMQPVSASRAKQRMQLLLPRQCRRTKQ